MHREVWVSAACAALLATVTVALGLRTRLNKLPIPGLSATRAVQEAGAAKAARVAAGFRAVLPGRPATMGGVVTMAYRAPRAPS